MRTRDGTRERLVVLMLLAVLAACSSDVTVMESGGGGGPGDTTGTVRRGTLAVTVRAAAADLSVAQALGRADGTLAGATVTIARVGGSGEATATADGSGVARFSELLPGTWQVSALRTLTGAEVATLPSADRDVTAFAGATAATVGNGASAATDLTAVAGRRGSLVISQIMPAFPLGPDGNFYSTGHYLRVYNNSDTTIYLDGKVIALGLPNQYRSLTSPAGCDSLERWRFDPEGIWARFIYAFPGSGRQYPLLPGRGVTTATDAVNHASAITGLADLSNAEFEYIGPTDVDNPGAVNMLRVGPADYAEGVIGRGLMFGNQPVFVLADRIDSSEYRRERIPAIAVPEFWRLPTARILDVVTVTYVPEVQARQQFPPCEQFVLPMFDRAYGAFMGPDNVFYSFSRKRFGTSASGAPILLRTRTTAQDFERINDSLLRW